MAPSTYVGDGLSDYMDRRLYPESITTESKMQEGDDEDDEMGGLTPTRNI